MLIRVLFPAPFGPNSPNISPSSIASEMLFKAFTGPVFVLNVLLTFDMVSGCIF